MMENFLHECVHSSLRSYLYKNATFLCERLCADFPSESNAHLLATCYFRNNQGHRAYHVLKGTKSRQCRLFMSRAVEPERLVDGRESSQGFVDRKEDVSSLKDLIAPLDSMPPVEFAFAYGSGVFPQRAVEAPMVDYILGVSSPVDWHIKNLEQNPRHYSSWLAWFGGRAVSNVAEKLGAGVHFNAFVPWKNKRIKYGVISVDNLVKDVYTWQRLYVGGRLQKPVRFLVDRIHGEEMNRKNLQAALTAALLLLPAEFTEEDLYAAICGLSYSGDVRMFFAEDKQKVRKIVQGCPSLFQDLYKEPINKYASRDILHPPEVFSSDLKSRFKQDGRISTKYLLLSSLPACVLQRLARQTGTQYDSTIPANMAIAKAVVNSTEGHAKLVTRAVSSVVRASSFRQMLSGFFAAGGVNAMHYVGRKISKAWQSR